MGQELKVSVKFFLVLVQMYVQFFSFQRFLIIKKVLNANANALFFRKYDAFFSLPKKCAKNYPELLLPVHGNDKILILNHILQVENYHSFQI